MELLEGETIAARLKSGPLPADEALRYAAQIASALADAPERGVVHRDLKPGNIMLTKSGAKVLDFGLATWEGDDTLTHSGMVMGTPAYMAPEQRGQPAKAVELPASASPYERGYPEAVYLRGLALHAGARCGG